MKDIPCNEIDMSRVEAAVSELLIAIGEDPDREGLKDTPARIARSCAEIFSGIHEDPAIHLSKQFQEPDFEEMVMVRDIPFTSMCEHHLLPFTGRAHVAYIPREGCITGLSKLARCVEGFARRPQVQERMTSQIANALFGALNPLGVLVVLEAEHSCMSARGIKKPGSVTLTSAVRGIFREDKRTRAEALSLLRLSV